MPLYEYKCSACSASFEELVPSADVADQVACPHCGSRRVARQPSVFAAHASDARRSTRPGPCGQCCSPDGSCPMAS